MKEKNMTRPKSYTSIYDLYNIQNNKNSAKRKSVENYLSQLINLPFITLESYQMTKNNDDQNRVPSTSTFFYDLDTIAKRKSFNFLSEVTLPKDEVNTKIKRERVKSKGKNNPNRKYSYELITRDKDDYSTEIKKIFPRDSEESSNYNLRTIKNSNTHLQRNRRNLKEQKMWKYTKYHVGNCSAFTENGKKKNNHKKHHDSSYCNRNSITKFNDNTNSIKPKDQLSSIMLIKKDNNKNKSDENSLDNSYTLTEDSFTDASFNKYLSKYRTKRIKKHREITCPNCKEKVLVTTVEEDKGSDTKKIDKRYDKIEPSKAINYRYPCNDNYDNITKAGCSHEPHCELIPVCQMVQPDQSSDRPRGLKLKGFKSPRTLRIIKACRHHPPCAMVPSCQRIHVLKNTCQYLSECPHRPRCVNLPLCAPYSKTMNINQFSTKNTELETAKFQMNRYNYIPQEHQPGKGIDMIYRNQLNKTEETIDYFNPCLPAFLMNPNINHKSYSPYQISTPIYTNFKLNQSCQYDSIQENNSNLLENEKSEGVIFIRDVGCQFRNKNHQEPKPYESRESKTSSAGIDNEDSSQLTNGSLRSEDKVKNQRPDVDSTDLSSINESSHCTSSEQKTESDHRRECTTGFVPKNNTSQFVAFSTHTEPMLTAYISKERDQDIPFDETCSNISPTRVMSRRSFLKQKYKKIFCMRRRRKSRVNNQSAYCCLRRIVNHQTIK